VEIPLQKKVKLFIKREDLIHTEISGNKYWKLFYNVKNYLDSKPKNSLFITFGGAFSNHISAVSFLGKILNIKTIGIIRGEELKDLFSENPTLSFARNNGMELHFVSREEYRNKDFIKNKFQKEFPDSLIIEEGGTNDLAVEGIKFMLGNRTMDFDYLCATVGTGGTLAGISKFCEATQKIVGFKTVKDNTLENRIFKLSGKQNFELVEPTERYGKIADENIRFINWFYDEYKIPLDPIYTGKMMQKIFKLIHENYFPENSKILAFHTGGLQGIAGANQLLKKQNRILINFET
jgi:1-aminocyclopropane-1-carboxylate deaminase